MPRLQEFLVSVEDWYHVPAGASDLLSPRRLAFTGTGDAYTSPEHRDKAVDNSGVTMRRYDSVLPRCSIYESETKVMVLGL